MLLCSNTINSGLIEQETIKIRIGAMTEKTIFFDFDDTLVDTSDLRPYRKTAKGRRFIADHPNQVSTKLINPDLLNLFNKLAQRNLVAIATNSARDYTKKLLNKHGFSTDIPIYYNLHKPCHDKLSHAIDDQCDESDDALYVGDSASDIIAAHGCQIPSIAVTWGNTSTTSKLQKAEPTRIVQTVKELKIDIQSFRNGELSYEKRLDPENYLFLDEQPDDAKIECYSLHTYYPIQHPNFYNYNSWSNEILRFKDMKDFTIGEVQNGATDTFYNNGTINRGLTLKPNFEQLYKDIFKFINELDIKGKSYAIAAPNSAPEYCYKCDVNQIMVNRFNRKIFEIDKSCRKRILFRVFPKRASHMTGARDNSEHYDTIGIKSYSKIPGDVDNLIIFDDVSTTHTQLTCLANIMKNIFEFDGKFIGLTLGQTTNEYF